MSVPCLFFLYVVAFLPFAIPLSPFLGRLLVLRYGLFTSVDAGALAVLSLLAVVLLNLAGGLAGKALLKHFSKKASTVPMRPEAVKNTDNFGIFLAVLIVSTMAVLMLVLPWTWSTVLLTPCVMLVFGYFIIGNLYCLPMRAVGVQHFVVTAYEGRKLRVFSINGRPPVNVKCYAIRMTDNLYLF